jgi:hypothetical protein
MLLPLLLPQHLPMLLPQQLSPQLPPMYVFFPSSAAVNLTWPLLSLPATE